MEPVEFCSTIQAISDLCESFTHISESYLRDLTENKTRAEELRKLLILLPLSLDSHINTPIHQNVDEIENTKKLSAFFNLLNERMWNFFDYCVLKYLIDQLGNDHVRDLMKRYTFDFALFEQNTPLHSFFENWPGRMMKPAGYAEVTTSIQADPQHYTLAQLNKLRQHNNLYQVFALQFRVHNALL